MSERANTVLSASRFLGLTRYAVAGGGKGRGGRFLPRVRLLGWKEGGDSKIKARKGSRGSQMAPGDTPPRP